MSVGIMKSTSSVRFSVILWLIYIVGCGSSNSDCKEASENNESPVNDTIKILIIQDLILNQSGMVARWRSNTSIVWGSCNVLGTGFGV
jgi:hypothetical protein